MTNRIIDVEQFNKLAHLMDQLHAGSDRERDFGHRLWLILKDLEDQTATALELDAKRYAKLNDLASLQDPYDRGGTQRSSWNWTIELETGLSGGMWAPSHAPTFQELVDKLPDPEVDIR